MDTEQTLEEWEQIFTGPESFEFTDPDGSKIRAVPLTVAFPGILDLIVPKV
jgi:hypothetical protein